MCRRTFHFFFYCFRNVDFLRVYLFRPLIQKTICVLAAGQMIPRSASKSIARMRRCVEVGVNKTLLELERKRRRVGPTHTQESMAYNTNPKFNGRIDEYGIYRNALTRNEKGLVYSLVVFTISLCTCYHYFVCVALRLKELQDPIIFFFFSLVMAFK